MGKGTKWERSGRSWRTKCLECGAPTWRAKSYCARCYQNVRRGIPTDVIDLPTRQECELAQDPGFRLELLMPRTGS